MKEIDHTTDNTLQALDLEIEILSHRKKQLQKEKTKLATNQRIKSHLKECAHCGKTKNIAHYRKDPNTVDGWTDNCFLCQCKLNPPVVAPEKTCTKCRVLKPACDFSRNVASPGGLDSWCKDCKRLKNHDIMPDGRKRNQHEHERRRFNKLANIHNARALKYGKTGDLTKEQLEELWTCQQGRCQRCGTSENVRFDHIRPLRLDGNSTISNIQLLCQDCHVNKNY
jgi:5-methylcytosine-specific restriction endonuclease McrA